MNGGDSMANEEIVSLGRPLPRIASVEPLDGRRVRIAWSSGVRAGQCEAVDLGPVIANHRHFVPLRGNDALFRSLRPVNDGTGIEWDEGIAMSAARIEAIPNRSISNDEFRHVMDDLDMTLEGDGCDPRDRASERRGLSQDETDPAARGLGRARSGSIDGVAVFRLRHSGLRRVVSAPDGFIYRVERFFPVAPRHRRRRGRRDRGAVASPSPATRAPHTAGRHSRRTDRRRC